MKTFPLRILKKVSIHCNIHCNACIESNDGFKSTTHPTKRYGNVRVIHLNRCTRFSVITRISPFVKDISHIFSLELRDISLIQRFGIKIESTRKNDICRILPLDKPLYSKNIRRNIHGVFCILNTQFNYSVYIFLFSPLIFFSFPSSLLHRIY